VVLPATSPTAEAARRGRLIEGARTTLADTRIEPLNPELGWFARSWGTKFVKQLDLACRREFADCEITLEGESVLVYRFRYAARAVRVAFPADYPRAAAAVSIRQGNHVDRVRIAGTEDAGRFYADLLTALGGPGPGASMLPAPDGGTGVL
jgi:hypothetical protein